MIRISTIFVGICMVLVSASLGMILFAISGLSGLQSGIVALTVLTFMIMFSAVALRTRDRSDVDQQIDDLSRGTGDLARQVAEFGRRLAALEGRIVSSNSAGHDQIQTVMGEIGELSSLVRELASSVAGHDDLIAAGFTPTVTPHQHVAQDAMPPLIEHPAPLPELPATPVVTVMPVAPAAPSPEMRADQMLAKVKAAIEANRIDIYLQPIVTLPQRKVRFYEAVTRLRDESDTILTAESFIGIAEAAGLMGRIDNAVMLRCMQVLRRLMVRNKDVGVFCNVAAATLRNEAAFGQMLDFLEANRALAASFVLEFKQATFRNLSPIESERIAQLAQRGFRFSIDTVTDLRIEPRTLADRGVRYIKVSAALLLDSRQTAASDIDASDLSDLLGRFGIDLIAERIEGERAVVDLLDFDVRFGQGFLFAAPRPLRPDAVSATAEAPDPAHAPDPRPAHVSDPVPQDTYVSKRPSTFDVARSEPARATGLAALVRR